MKLVIEPADQPPHLVPHLGLARHQRRLGVALFDVFADRRTFGHHPAVHPEHRNLARRVALQEVRVLLPVAFLDQFDLELFLGKDQPDLAAERRQRDVEQADHSDAPPETRQGT